MNKSVSLTYFPPTRDYRKAAQLAWGLTDKQMNGMHVHHQPPRSEGGRNVPEHLYVCSPSIHAQGWHNGEYFIEQATAAGKEFGSLGGTVGGKCPWWTKDGEDVRSWECPGEGWTRGKSRTAEVGSLPYWNNGKENRRSEESPGEGWVPGLAEVWWTNGKEDKKQSKCPGEGWVRGRVGMNTNTQKWKCTKTGRVSTAGPLTLYQRSVGVDPSNRVKVVE
jgi:hypothetical protein